VLKIIFFFLIIIFLLIIFGLIGYSKPFTFPEETDFLLKANITDTTWRVGDALYVEVIFQNLTDLEYTLDSDATFSQSGLIHINIFKINELPMITVGTDREVKLKGKQQVQEIRKFYMNKEGTYKVIINSNFYIYNPKTLERKTYKIKIDPIIIEAVK